MIFKNNGESIDLYCKFNNFDKVNYQDIDLEVNLTLSNFPEESMVIASGWPEDRKTFYYNNKINCMTAHGYCIVGDKKYEFNEKDSLGTLDWGRGVWTYSNTWYWVAYKHT